MDNEQLKSNLLSSKHWLRLVFMLLFAALLQVASLVVSIVVILQFLFSLITGQDNKNLRDFGAAVTEYIHQSLKFLTYNSEEKPFPFSDWPNTPQANNFPVEESAEQEPVVEEIEKPKDPFGDQIQDKRW